METIRNFEELIDHLRLRGDRKRVAVVWAADSQTQMSVSQGLEVGFIEAVFVGCREQVEANAVLMRHREHIFSRRLPTVTMLPARPWRWYGRARPTS